MPRLMNGLLPAILLGCSGAPIDGTLTDGLSGAPIADVRIVAKAAGDVSMSCMAFEATTDAAGKFSIEGACTGSAYTLSLGDDSWWVPALEEVPDGGKQGLALEAWRNSSGGGAYTIIGGVFNALRSHADVKSEKILNTAEVVRFPWPTVPGKVPLIEASDHLVLVGTNAVETYEILPLVRSDARKFGDKDTWVTMEPWYYIGTSFTSDETFERVAAQVDESKVILKTSEGRAGKYIPGSAVAEGRYVVLGPKSKAVSIVDFGKPYTAPAAPEGG